MKRAMLIAGGTVGGLGAVLSITPPDLASNSLSTISGASAATSEITPSQNTTATQSNNSTQSVPAATKKSTATTSKATTKTTTKQSATTTNNSAATTTNEPAASSSNGASGSFTGDAVDVGYGMMQVKITVSNGRITEATAVQAPSGRKQRWSDMALPQLRSQTLAAQSAAISGVSGASYTAYGWYQSLITALQKAGMPTGV